MSVMISTTRSRSGAFVDTYDCDDVWPLGDGRIVFKASMGSDTCAPPSCDPPELMAWNTCAAPSARPRLPCLARL